MRFKNKCAKKKIAVIFGGYALILGLLHLKRFMRSLKQINSNAS